MTEPRQIAVVRSRETVRGKKLCSLGAPRGLETTGFRRALRRLAAEFAPDDLNDDLEPDDEFLDPIEWQFEDWFGDLLDFVPAGYVIERREEGRGIWDITVHVYELEMSHHVPLWKIGRYGTLADGDGPLFCLHIFDRHGRERVFDNDILVSLEFYCFCDRQKLNAAQQKEVDEILPKLLKGSAPESTIPKSERTKKWKAAYDALREMGVKIGDDDGTSI